MTGQLHILIACLGSYGDTHPFLGLGQKLAARGHDVTLIAPAMYEALAKSIGLEFAAESREATCEIRRPLLDDRGLGKEETRPAASRRALEPRGLASSSDQQ